MKSFLKGYKWVPHSSIRSLLKPKRAPCVNESVFSTTHLSKLETSPVNYFLAKSANTESSVAKSIFFAFSFLSTFMKANLHLRFSDKDGKPPRKFMTLMKTSQITVKPENPSSTPNQAFLPFPLPPPPTFTFQPPPRPQPSTNLNPLSPPKTPLVHSCTNPTRFSQLPPGPPPPQMG